MLMLAAMVMAMPGTAHAYIGPGASLGAIIVTITVLLGVLFLVIGLVWYPLKRLMKGKKSAGKTSDQADTDPQA
ncbi:MAG: hypothetical protein KI792_04340 [Alphaproteobacteria bacterium]|nr:hypothetical protein [Alphaproteobacteria bacterium SS10]